MTSLPDKALLPAGMQDGLPPAAGQEARTAERLMTHFATWGYAQVKPPLMEFEENLLFGTGKAVADQAFRVQDPISQRMLALRPDMTLQVARIAHSRLSLSPRPLRLAYSGQVARVKGSLLRPERQFGQVGVELIGATGPAADVEIILMAAEALEAAGVKDFSVDLGLPTLSHAVTAAIEMDADMRDTLKIALDRKDAAGIKALTPALGKKAAQSLITMLGAVGPVSGALSKLDAIDLPPAAALQRSHLNAVVEGIFAARPDLVVTLDPVETRGFEYHSGVTFALFARSVMSELGRGGRYEAGTQDAFEPATGLTLFMDTLMQAVTTDKVPDCIWLPYATPAATARTLRAGGWHTLAALTETTDAAEAEAEAKRQGCTHVLKNGTPHKLN